MMGGAYTALSDDASGSWYNPAGLAFTRGNDLSMSANAFTKTRRSVSGALGGSDVAEASTSIYPAFAGGTSGFGPFRIGYSFFTSDHDNTDESLRYSVAASETSSSYIYSRRLLSTGELLHAGASLSFPLGSHLSVGFSEFYYRRTRQASLVESAVYATGAAFDSNIRQSTLNEGSVAIAGFMFKSSPVNIGLTARLPHRLTDRTVIEANQTTFTGTNQDRTESISKPHAFDEVTPPEYTLGIAWQPAIWLTVTSDYTYIPSELSPHRDEDGVDTKQTQNWAIGSELAVGSLVLRGGLFSNNSLVDEPTSAKTGQPAWIDYRGWSGGIGWKGKSLETSVGLIRQAGQGKDQSVSGSAEIYRVDSESTTYLLTSRYSLSQ